MRVGDKVRWYSPRGLKEGQIIALVPPHADVRPMVPPTTPGKRSMGPYRLRTPLIVHSKPRFLIRVWRNGGLWWGIPRSTNNNDYGYYTPTVEWLEKTGEVISV